MKMIRKLLLRKYLQGRKKMDKYDYITATTLEEKVRLEKLIKYMEENNIETD